MSDKRNIAELVWHKSSQIDMSANAPNTNVEQWSLKLEAVQ